MRSGSGRSSASSATPQPWSTRPSNMPRTPPRRGRDRPARPHLPHDRRESPRRAGRLRHDLPRHRSALARHPHEKPPPQMGPTPLSLRVAHIARFLLVHLQVTVRLRERASASSGQTYVFAETCLSVPLRGSSSVESTPALRPATRMYFCMCVHKYGIPTSGL